MPGPTPEYDAIVIGSGFGGSFAAEPLVRAGARVLMLERGGWVPRDHRNWGPQGTMELSPYYSMENAYRVLEGGQTPTLGTCACVGGQSVFYGGVSLRMRETDFDARPEVLGDSGARWPIGYHDLRPYYERVENRLDVAGIAGLDPTEPARGGVAFPQAAPSLSPTSQRVADAGASLGLRPYPLPLAIHYANGNGNGNGNGARTACLACQTCDTFACAVSAKNDLATTVLPDLLERGLELLPETIAVRLVERNGAVREVECIDRARRRRVSFRGSRVLLAAGALASPHLLLASGLERRNPASHAVGRYLVRHCNGIVMGLFPRLPEGGRHFHKQVGFNDFYWGHPAIDHPDGPLGSIQQLQTPPLALVKAYLPRLAGPVLGPVVSRMTGLLVMAEDQPRKENGLGLDPLDRDSFGVPRLLVRHRHTERDVLARRALLRQAGRVLRAAGAAFLFTHHIKTFSHAAGTLRFGDDPRQAPLDRFCRFRGIDNLFVVDGSFMPTAGGVNPSLTIGANAMRVGEAIASDEACGPPT